MGRVQSRLRASRVRRPRAGFGAPGEPRFTFQPVFGHTADRVKLHARMLRLGVAVAALAGCAARSPSRAVDAAACPTVALLEALHAATFHFEHGSAADGRAALATARAGAAGSSDPTLKALLDRLAVVDASIDRDEPRARGELEWIRAAFRDWSCLPEPLHQRFHAALPTH
jgi:hypothetical protein